MILGPLLPPAQLPLPSPFSSFLAEAQPEQPRQPGSASPWRPALAQQPRQPSSAPAQRCSNCRRASLPHVLPLTPGPARQRVPPPPSRARVARNRRRNRARSTRVVGAPPPRARPLFKRSRAPARPSLAPRSIFRSRSRLGSRNRRRTLGSTVREPPSPSHLRPYFPRGKNPLAPLSLPYLLPWHLVACMAVSRAPGKLLLAGHGDRRLGRVLRPPLRPGRDSLLPR